MNDTRTDSDNEPPSFGDATRTIRQRERTAEGAPTNPFYSVVMTYRSSGHGGGSDDSDR